MSFNGASKNYYEKPRTKKQNHNRRSKAHKKHHHYKPERNLMLVKVSHVNEVMVDFKAEVFDNQDNKECHFVRILRVGPDIQEKAAVPGTLIIVHTSAGKYLEKLSKKFGEEYYLISQEDVLEYFDM